MDTEFRINVCKSSQRAQIEHIPFCSYHVYGSIKMLQSPILSISLLFAALLLKLRVSVAYVACNLCSKRVY